MASRRKFSLIYAPIVKEHFRVIERKYYSQIRSAIEAELQFEPDQETRNRKPLRQPAVFDAEWELRCGPDNRFRVFYDIDLEQYAVNILAVGIKERNRLWIEGKEVTQ